MNKLESLFKQNHIGVTGDTLSFVNGHTSLHIRPDLTVIYASCLGFDIDWELHPLEIPYVYTYVYFLKGTVIVRVGHDYILLDTRKGAWVHYA